MKTASNVGKMKKGNTEKIGSKNVFWGEKKQNQHVVELILNKSACYRKPF